MKKHPAIHDVQLMGIKAISAACLGCDEHSDWRKQQVAAVAASRAPPDAA